MHDTTDRTDRFDRSIDRPTISSRAVDVHRPVVTGRSWTHSTSPRANQNHEIARAIRPSGGGDTPSSRDPSRDPVAGTDRPTDRSARGIFRAVRGIGRQSRAFAWDDRIVVRSRDGATRERERAPRTGVNDEGRARSCARSWARIAARARRARGKGAWKVRGDTWTVR